MDFNVKVINWHEFEVLLSSRSSKKGWRTPKVQLRVHICLYLYSIKSMTLVFDAVEKRELIRCEIIYFNYSIVKNLLK